MSVVHVTQVRRDVADFILAKLDAGSGAGHIEFQTSGNVQVATCQFSDPAFGAANGSAIATANAIASDTNATGGTVAKAKLFDSDNNLVMTCSVTGGGGGGDFEFDNVVVDAGQTVTVDSLTYEAMP